MRSLRTRLLVALLALVFTVIVVFDLVLFATLRSYVSDRVDAAVNAVRNRIVSQVKEYDPPGSGLAGQVKVLGATDFYIEIVRPGGQVKPLAPALRDADQAPPRMPSDLETVRGRLVTVPADGPGPSYRVSVSRLPRRQGTLVVAASLRDADDVLGRLLLVEAVGTGLVLVVLTGAGLLIVRRALRPLESMAADADAIASGELSRRVPADARTEVGRLGLALNSMLDRLAAAFGQERAVQARLRRFVADASHELRTPVSAVLGYADLRRQGALDDPAAVDRAMGGIADEALRMQRLVDDLLLLARVDAQPQASLSRVDLASVASAAVSASQAVEPARVHNLSAASAYVLGDPDRLRRVVDNLLANVRAHTPPTATAEVTVGSSNGSVVLTVADTGPGIAPEDLPYVFERFYRAERSRSRSYGGSGLGLAIVAALVQAHHGRVDVESEPGSGTTIRVHLPAARALS